MKIINKTTQEEFDFLDGITFEQGVDEIMHEAEMINKNYPEENLIIDRSDLIAA
jgi:hypothetical protein